MKIGDRVRYIGRVQDDIYHGALCGRVGTIEQLTPWIGFKPEGEIGIFAVGPTFIEKVKG